MRITILIIAFIPAGLWVLEEKVEMPVHPLRWCMMVLGTVCTLHALYDCLHDVLLKKIDNRAQVRHVATQWWLFALGSRLTLGCHLTLVSWLTLRDSLTQSCLQTKLAVLHGCGGKIISSSAMSKVFPPSADLGSHGP